MEFENQKYNRGFLASDPIFKEVKNDKAILYMTVIKGNKEKSVAIKVRLWDDLARQFKDQLKKGHKVSIKGTIKEEKYDNSKGEPVKEKWLTVQSIQKHELLQDVTLKIGHIDKEAEKPIVVLYDNNLKQNYIVELNNALAEQLKEKKQGDDVFLNRGDVRIYEGKETTNKYLFVHTLSFPKNISKAKEEVNAKEKPQKGSSKEKPQKGSSKEKPQKGSLKKNGKEM